MSTLPLTEAILLEIHQSLGCEPYQTTKKRKFSNGQNSLQSHKAMGQEVLHAIFEAMDMDPIAQMDALNNFMEFGNSYKSLELNTWTFAADQRQVLWALLGHIFVPVVARRMGFWSLGHVLDKGMPGGRFWYLPEHCEIDGKSSLKLPVAQVVEWLLDLLGMPVEHSIELHGEKDTDALRRSLHNWRDGTLIRSEIIKEYFSDSTQLDFRGVFSPDSQRTAAEQFSDALDFVTRKNLNADRLRQEIPMTQDGRLEAILDGKAAEDEQAELVRCLADRYAPPSLKTIRQRLLLARAVQDGYVRLLKTLCPGVDQCCTDARQNKVLQLFAIYKLVYNLTIDAWRHCQVQGETAENHWFEQHLPDWEKHGLFLSILPSRQQTAIQQSAHWLTRWFFDMKPGAELEDHVGLDAPSAMPIIQRNVTRARTFADEIIRELRLVARMKTSSPWRALQGEDSYWVIGQVAQNQGLSQIARQAAVQRLRDMASTPSQTVQSILPELDNLLNGDRRHRPKDAQARVQSLLDEASSSEGYGLWQAAILQYKAKHLLACNDFDGSLKFFRQALEAGRERNYGPLRGEVARDTLAVELANQKLVANNHEKYYREMLAGGMMQECEEIPPMQEIARWASGYFWDVLYKPYPGIPVEKRRSLALTEAMINGLMPLLAKGNEDGLQSWIDSNRQWLKSRLPDVEGNSALMALIKMRSHFVEGLARMQSMPIELRDDVLRFEDMLRNWRQFIGQLARQCPQQLNMADLKGQTPLMLVTESGDAELVEALLQAGADPDMQDWQGMTALHSACKARVNRCVDALLDGRCKLDKLTHEGRSPLHTATWAGNIHAVSRLVVLAPAMAWQRDSFLKTPLELAQSLIEHPNSLALLAQRRAQDGKSCASRQELQNIVEQLQLADGPRDAATPAAR